MTRPHPQRIIPTSPVGSLLKRTDAPTSDARIRKHAGYEDKDYLAMIRMLPCLCCGMEPSEAAHVRYASAAFGAASGMQRKPPDSRALPLCASCHRLDRDAQHQGSERAFWERLGINPHLVCERLHAQRGDPVAMRAVIFVAISERSRVG